MNCPICSLDKPNFPQSFLPKFVECPRCGGHFMKAPQKATYPREYFRDDTKIIFLSEVFKIPLKIFLSMRVKLIQKSINKNSKILDYGCGSGQVISALLQKGYKAVGYEPSIGALKLTRALGLPIYNKVKSIDGGYDLVMFWHSLEHTDNPRLVIKKISKLLSKKGKLVIAVPNSDSWNAKIGRDKWFHYSYPLHKVHFNPRSINVMLTGCGFSITNIDYFNPEYTFSGLVQTLLNFFLPKDVLYSVVANRRSTKQPTESLIYTFFSITILVLLGPFILIVYVVELIFKKTDAILITACRSTNSVEFVNPKI